MPFIFQSATLFGRLVRALPTHSKVHYFTLHMETSWRAHFGKFFGRQGSALLHRPITIRADAACIVATDVLLAGILSDRLGAELGDCVIGLRDHHNITARGKEESCN